MARVKLSQEFKDAISDLSDKEKDKLLFRLLAKEPDLVEQLSFRLLEDGLSTEDRRDELRTFIIDFLERYQNYYYSPGILLLELREISGKISHHVKITKDKYGEIELNFLMLNLALGYFHERIDTARRDKARTLNEYVVKRALKLLTLLKKIHEDHHMDFWDDMKDLGNHITSIDSMMHTAIMHGLDVNFLIRGEI